MLGAQAHDRHRLRRIADLAELGHRVERSALVEVAHQPVLGEAVVRQPGPHPRAHEARAAVAADHIARADAVTAAVEVDAGDLHLVGAGVEPVDGDALAHLDRGQRAAGAIEHRLELGLVHHVHRCPATARGIVVVDLEQDLAVGVDPLVGRLHLGAAGHLVGDPELLEQAHRLVVEGGGPREVVEPRVALEHDDPVALGAEQRGEHHARRPVADDRDIVRLRGAAVPMVRGADRPLHRPTRRGRRPGSAPGWCAAGPRGRRRAGRARTGRSGRRWRPGRRPQTPTGRR